MVVNIKDFFKDKPDFIQNSVLIKSRNENKIVIYGAEWLSSLDRTISYDGDYSNKVYLVKKGLADYYHHNPKLHYYIVYYNDNTKEEQGLIGEVYNFLVNVGADVILLEEIEWMWEPYTEVIR